MLSILGCNDQGDVAKRLELLSKYFDHERYRKPLYKPSPLCPSYCKWNILVISSIVFIYERGCMSIRCQS